MQPVHFLDPMKQKLQISNQPGFVVDTYQQMTRFVGAFADGHLNLLILLGEPGLAKSQTVRRVMRDACWIEGNATAFGVYTAAWNHRDRVIVLDDVDSLYSDRNAVRLLKTLCQTDPVKRVSWQTASAASTNRAFRERSRQPAASLSSRTNGGRSIRMSLLFRTVATSFDLSHQQPKFTEKFVAGFQMMKFTNGSASICH